jgi:uncharacterized protein (DUF983 family)
MTEAVHGIGASHLDKREIPNKRELGLAMRRGFLECCPNCAKSAMFRAYLKVVDECAVCGEELHHQRADDAPPYFTMLIVGHFIVAGVLAAEEVWPNSPMWIDAIIWVVLTIVASLLILPRVKGALVGYQWAMRMHGFGGPEAEAK